MRFKIMALAALVGFGALSVQANELPSGPHIVTSGMTSVDATSDIATLAIEVNIAAKDAASAKKQADERVAQYLFFLERNQIAKKDINATNPCTQPGYGYRGDKSVLKGYHTVRTAEATPCQSDKLNALFDGALKTGLNEIRPVSPGVAWPDAYRDKARKTAVGGAIHQAEQLATGFNSKLGPVYSVRYHAPNHQPSSTVWMMKAGVALATSAQETYEQPIIQLDDQVDVIFRIEPTAGQPAATPAKTQ